VIPWVYIKRLIYFAISFAFFSSIFIHDLSGQNFQTGRFYAYPVADSFLQQISYDGSLDEWNNYLENYSFNNRIEGQKDVFVKDENAVLFDCFIGWNSLSNRIYIVLRYKTKTLIKDKYSHFWFTDKIEICANPINCNVMFDQANDHLEEFKSTVRYIFTHKEKDRLITYGNQQHYADWLTDSSCIDYGMQASYIDEQGFYLISFEMGMQLWDRWEYEGPEFSLQHVLKENQVIGLSVLINNNYRGPGNVTFSLLDGIYNWENNTFGISKIQLLPQSFVLSNFKSHKP
jgi:hypothetical protein